MSVGTELLVVELGAVVGTGMLVEIAASGAIVEAVVGLGSGAGGRSVSDGSDGVVDIEVGSGAVASPDEPPHAVIVKANEAAIVASVPRVVMWQGHRPSV